jgi:hypothetical protein
VSTCWGYRCETCKVESDHWYNRGNDFLQCLLENIGAVNEFQKAFADFIDWRIEITFPGGYGSEPLDFLRNHEGHNIIIKNEYGEDLAEWTERMETYKKAV